MMEDSQLNSLLVLSFLTEEEDLEEDLEVESDSEEDLAETHTDGPRLVTTPNTPLLTHLTTNTFTL